MNSSFRRPERDMPRAAMTTLKHSTYRAFHVLYLLGAFACAGLGMYLPESGGLRWAQIAIALNTGGCAAYLAVIVVIRLTAPHDRIMDQLLAEIQADRVRAEMPVPLVTAMLYSVFGAFLVTTEQYFMALALLSAPCLKQVGDALLRPATPRAKK